MSAVSGRSSGGGEGRKGRDFAGDTNLGNGKEHHSGWRIKAGKPKQPSSRLPEGRRRRRRQQQQQHYRQHHQQHRISKQVKKIRVLAEASRLLGMKTLLPKVFERNIC
ncbi:uncharacterized protein EKO05_0009822 [Ascochyta rabiei]|uniref:uncharacterized protein n=1 Tax=Didymella rabiei TaxID=5454 RepID=UPI0021FF42AA|nr:uncharacterized protein EKO05_0009822 [Ascochyta rabiei]UPX19563.1 hypothetical protein EKO05_0009822 [Ascochyta rabiei]